MSRVAFAFVLAGLAARMAGFGAPEISGQGREAPLTRPERTSYRETSTYEDVVDFVKELAGRSSRMQVTTLGYTTEGRRLPAVIVGELEDGDPETVRASGKVRVYLQGNIHAGEVCGKEALQMLLRDLSRGGHREWLDSLVLLVVPIYNADGNERVRLTNRPYQHGPVGGMGQRANAQGLDLNRDNMKLETPEARSVVRFWERYDPHIIMDLHTTNGTRHAYRVTYSPPLHPDTDSGIIDLMRGSLLPDVTRAIKAEYGWDLYYYGNLPWPGSDAERGWYTFSHLPRYLTNYVGLRNRLGLLSEAYAYSPFSDRVAATLRFVEEVVDYAYRHASSIDTAVRVADSADIVGERLTVGAIHERSAEPVEILLGDVVEERNPYSGRPMLRRLDFRRPERMPEFGVFQPSETERAPAAYFIPGELRLVLNLLDDHGIEWTRLAESIRVVGEKFIIDSTVVAPREYQGHTQRTLYGSYEEAELSVPAGTAVVSVRQPLGRLAFALLEPRADDGLVRWNVLDEALTGARLYPITRTSEEW